MAREIPLTRGLVAVVDDGDYERFGSLKWIAKPASQKAAKWYACRTVKREGRAQTIYLHRLITMAPAHLLVDHINGDGLDNRRENLRLCTHSGNSSNRTYQSASGYRGVHRHHGGWRAQVEVGGTTLRLSAPTAEMAARSYDALAREFHGEFAVLNFPSRSLAQMEGR